MSEGENGGVYTHMCTQAAIGQLGFRNELLIYSNSQRELPVSWRNAASEWRISGHKSVAKPSWHVPIGRVFLISFHNEWRAFKVPWLKCIGEKRGRVEATVTWGLAVKLRTFKTHPSLVQTCFFLRSGYWKHTITNCDLKQIYVNDKLNIGLFTQNA